MRGDARRLRAANRHSRAASAMPRSNRSRCSGSTTPDCTMCRSWTFAEIDREQRAGRAGRPASGCRPRGRPGRRAGSRPPAGRWSCGPRPPCRRRRRSRPECGHPRALADSKSPPWTVGPHAASRPARQELDALRGSPMGCDATAGAVSEVTALLSMAGVSGSRRASRAGLQLKPHRSRTAAFDACTSVGRIGCLLTGAMRR